MYRPPSPQFDYHCKHYGHPSKFGYKDFIPMFTAEKFNTDEWADLYCRSGEKFAGPVAEHHDGFHMWNCSDTEWCASKMDFISQDQIINHASMHSVLNNKKGIFIND